MPCYNSGHVLIEDFLTMILLPSLPFLDCYDADNDNNQPRRAVELWRRDR
jgi:hypothetical protein